MPCRHGLHVHQLLRRQGRRSSQDRRRGRGQGEEDHHRRLQDRAAEDQRPRLQRDLSDSTIERNFGAALGHCLIAYEFLLKGLNSISINEKKVTEELNKHPEVIAEAIQTILRREGVKMPYEKLKELTRGKQVSLGAIYNFVDSLEVSPKIKKELKSFTPQNYIGLAPKLAKL